MAQEGKDRLIFVTKDQETPSNTELVADKPNDLYEEHRWTVPNGDINWNCHVSEENGQWPVWRTVRVSLVVLPLQQEDVKGMDCVDQFWATQGCRQTDRDLYPQEEEEERPVDQKKQLLLRKETNSCTRIDLWLLRWGKEWVGQGVRGCRCKLLPLG
uniref:Uncharacterized protein n=1 Tax=Sus scrofa TaxID=9823 RepID=A0A8D2A9G4_PIG